VVEVVGVLPRAAVEEPFERVQQMAGTQLGRVGDEHAPVVELAALSLDDGRRQHIEVVEVERARRREVAAVGVVRPLAEGDVLNQLRDQEVQVGVALAVAVARQIERDVVEAGREIGAVVEVEAAQEVLVGLTAAAVLRRDQAGHGLEHLRGA